MSYMDVETGKVRTSVQWYCICVCQPTIGDAGVSASHRSHTGSYCLSSCTSIHSCILNIKIIVQNVKLIILL